MPKKLSSRKRVRSRRSSSRKQVRSRRSSSRKRVRSRRSSSRKRVRTRRSKSRKMIRRSRKSKSRKIVRRSKSRKIVRNYKRSGSIKIRRSKNKDGSATDIYDDIRAKLLNMYSDELFKTYRYTFKGEEEDHTIFHAQEAAYGEMTADILEKLFKELQKKVVQGKGKDKENGEITIEGIKITYSLISNKLGNHLVEINKNIKSDTVTLSNLKKLDIPETSCDIKLLPRRGNMKDSTIVTNLNIDEFQTPYINVSSNTAYSVNKNNIVNEFIKSGRMEKTIKTTNTSMNLSQYLDFVGFHYNNKSFSRAIKELGLNDIKNYKSIKIPIEGINMLNAIKIEVDNLNEELMNPTTSTERKIEIRKLSAEKVDDFTALSKQIQAEINSNIEKHRKIFYEYFIDAVIVSFDPELFHRSSKGDDLSKSFSSISLEKTHPISLGSHPLTIHSFNTLNPEPAISMMTFGSFFGEDKIKIANLDKDRFDIMRKDKIIEMINSWMKKNTYYIICLQEVNKELLDNLTSLYGPMVKHTNGKDVSVSFQKKVSKEFVRVEYRVTISNLELVNSEDIEHVTKAGNNKNALFCKYKYGGKFIDSFNIHFHFSSTDADITNYANKIRDKVGSDDVCVVCGDFNKDVRDFDMEKFKEILLINDPDFVNSDWVKGDSLYTGPDISKDKKYGVDIYDKTPGFSFTPGAKFMAGLVDNILVGNAKPVIYIQSKFNDKDILYDIEQLHNDYEKNPEGFILPYDKYFSDHKPISTTIYV
jgi:hypothetical protein